MLIQRRGRDKQGEDKWPKHNNHRSIPNEKTLHPQTIIWPNRYNKDNLSQTPWLWYIAVPWFDSCSILVLLLIENEVMNWNILVHS